MIIHDEGSVVLFQPEGDFEYEWLTLATNAEPWQWLCSPRKPSSPPSKAFPYRIASHATGYSDDPKVGALQAKLSIMLEVSSQ